MFQLTRLRKNDDFSSCIKTGIKVNTKSFIIFINKNKINKTRLGISVSKKINKSAVIRNLIRRQIKSWFYTHKITLNKSFDIVFVIRSEYDTKKYNFLLNETIKLLHIKKLI